jgi:hypothetical protein
MTIVNGYCTLAELKDRLHAQRVYIASTISFTASTKTITDSAYGLKRFQTGDVIQISGAGTNNGYYNIAAGNTAGKIVVVENLATNAAAGTAITITEVTNLEDDVALEGVITGVSRLIDGYCRRRFYANSEDETRYYTAQGHYEVFTDDIVSLTSLATDEDGDGTFGTTWTVTDYSLWPYNAALEGKPYTTIRVARSAVVTFPIERRGVKVIGKFGYAATAPEIVRQACLLQSIRLFKRKDAPFGVMGSAEMGQVAVIPKIDPDIALMLESVRREF